jgi:hypothetical protein
MWLKSALFLVVVAIVLFSCSKNDAPTNPGGGGGGGGGGTDTTKKFSTNVYPILSSSCASCHQSGNQGAPIWFSSSATTTRSNLLDVATVGPCQGQALVIPNDAANSVLIKRLQGSSCGNQMPLGGSLSSANITIIQTWINQGALNN